MDEESRRPTRPSGLPRLSKLPVQSKLPVPTTSTIRPSSTRESLTTGASRNPKLRATASRDRLIPSSTTRPTASLAQAAPKPSPSSRLSISRSVGNLRAPQPTVSQDVSSPKPGSMGPPPPSYKPNTGGTLGRTTGTRRPTGQVSSTTAGQHARHDLTKEPFQDKSWDQPVAAAEEEWGTSAVKPLPPKGRLSLSERTMETLAQLPSSPALKSRGSLFFEPESAKKRQSSRPSSRLGSSSRPGSSAGGSISFRPSSRSNSRPSSSSGPEEATPNFRASTNTYRNPLTTIEGTPSRGKVNIRSVQTPSRKSSLGITPRSLATRRLPERPLTARPRTPSPERPAQEVTSLKYGAKTVAARPTGMRAPVAGLFKKPSVPSLDQRVTSSSLRKVSGASFASSATSRSGTVVSNPSCTSPDSTVTAESIESPAAATARKSSAALREQIAKAKAAKRAAASQQTVMSLDLPKQASIGTTQALKSPLIPTDTSFDFGLAGEEDPFNQKRDEGSQKKILSTRLATARTSGRLNIAAMGLREIPTEVVDMYSFDSAGGMWAESVDLTRFVAADNELEAINDDIFPDRDVQDMADDEDSQGNIFAGLEALDLHGNTLIALPMGLRRLSMLTSLNLSQNRLSNNCLEVLSQISSLKDLKLGGNLLFGPLDPSFSSLVNLEIVDLHGNNISSLPSNLGNLSKLRILNISENCFEALPFEILVAMPLIELSARKNQLTGTLIEDTVSSFPSLQMLDVSANQLTRLTSSARSASLEMPSLQQLCVSINRLQGLPDISTWTNLLTLSADENNINAFPDGFSQLQRLRSVNFSSNDIRVVPAEIGRMESLAMLQLSANPLRDKKFSSMSTDDLKETLASRLEPVSDPFSEVVSNPASDVTVIPYTQKNGQHDDEYDDRGSDLDDFATPPTSAHNSPVRSRSHTLSSQSWPIKANGVLDRSNTESSALHPVICSKMAAVTTIRDVQLHHNLFTTFPDSLSFFAESLTSLSLAHNQLTGDNYLGGSSGNDNLELPVLQELNLSSNHITSLEPLMSHLIAPALEKLDVSLNRISSLPSGSASLRTAFPSLSVLLISNNHLVDLDADSIRGLRIVEAANNDIAHLNPRIGLLGGGRGGLERLDVSGNRFRVPRYTVLERGTEVTLRWLRGRLPEAEVAAWKRSNGEHEDGDLE